jgi:hypothetical protein
MTRIRNGWTLTKKSWEVLRADRSLLIFPFLSAIFVMIAFAIIWGASFAAVPDLFPEDTGSDSESVNAAIYVIGAISAFVATTLAVYFNVALAACAARSLQGEDTRVGEGIRAANQRLGAILAWSVLATVVGLILRAIEARFRLVGTIVSALLGAAWAIASFFAIPLIALEGKGPIETLKESSKIVKERWGEGLTGYFAISIITFIAALALIVPTVILVVAAAEASVAAAVAIGLIGGLCLVLVMLISATLNQVFRVAVYQFARTGQANGPFNPVELNAAFVPKGEKPDFSGPQPAA